MTFDEFVSALPTALPANDYKIVGPGNPPTCAMVVETLPPYNPPMFESFFVRRNPRNAGTVLTSLLKFFSSGESVSLAWAVENRENFENAWKHSSDPATMVSLVSEVVPVQRLAVLLMAMAKLTLPYAGEQNLRMSKSLKMMDRWVRTGAPVEKFKMLNFVQNREAGPIAAESTAFWLTTLPDSQPRQRYFPARMVVRGVEDALTIAGRQTERSVDGKLARMIRQAFPAIKLTDFVMASRR